MSHAVHVTLVVVLVLSAGVWIGGYVAAAVMARSATATLAASDRIAFFRALGRSYLRVDVPALGVALIVGAVLLVERGWDAVAWAATIVAVVLVVALAVAIAQARRMTVLRTRALTEPDSAALVRRGAARAGMLRALLGVLTVVLVVLGAIAAG